jgi:hypothetical protein
MGAAFLAVFSLMLIGYKGLENFLTILGISAGGAGYKINEQSMVNLLGLLRRLVPGISPDNARLASWIVYACEIVFLCVVWKRSERMGEKQIGLAVLVALITVPHLHFHDLAMLLIPVTCLLALVGRLKILDGRIASLLPLVLSWLLIASNPLPLLKFNFPFLLEVVLILALWYPEKPLPGNGRTR